MPFSYHRRSPLTIKDILVKEEDLISNYSQNESTMYAWLEMLCEKEILERFQELERSDVYYVFKYIPFFTKVGFKSIYKRASRAYNGYILYL